MASDDGNVLDEVTSYVRWVPLDVTAGSFLWDKITSKKVDDGKIMVDTSFLITMNFFYYLLDSNYNGLLLS